MKQLELTATIAPRSTCLKQMQFNAFPFARKLQIYNTNKSVQFIVYNL